MIQKHIKIQPQAVNIPINSGLIARHNDAQVIQITSPRQSQSSEKLKIKPDVTTKPITVPITRNTTKQPLIINDNTLQSNPLQKDNNTCQIQIHVPNEPHELPTCGDKINKTNQNINNQQHLKPTIPQTKNVNAELQPQPIQLYDTPRKLMIDDVPDHRQHMLEMQNLLAKLKNDQKPEHTAIQMNNDRLI